MNRVLSAGLIYTAFFLCLRGTASAMVEFCPAHLQYERVGANTSLIRQQSSPTALGNVQAQTASLYGFELAAMGPRTITAATLAFDTDKGWFTVDVPAVTLVEKDRHYTGPSSTFTLQDYVSPIFYVRFPHAASVTHGWVHTAATQGDTQFGWDKQGTVQCDPVRQQPHVIATAAFNHAPSKTSDGGKNSLYTLDARDQDALSAVPRPTSLILTAEPASPLADASCTEAFQSAFVSAAARPAYPQLMSGFPAEATTTVELAIDAGGNLADAWVWGPTGQAPFDQAALQAAEHSGYTGGQAYCKPAAGYYFFRVTFDPNS
ncbi:MAG TPA: hypothetical protein VFH72_03175 [Candidatus Baltobacteraceae bacterium]|nr:hypothetical protein [Candidatus Baltobacteraceae bacterium]